MSERERGSVCEGGREKECACVCVCVRERERESARESERERAREKKRVRKKRSGRQIRNCEHARYPQFQCPSLTFISAVTRGRFL